MKLETRVHLCWSAFQLHLKRIPVFQAKHDPKKNPVMEQHRGTLSFVEEDKALTSEDLPGTVVTATARCHALGQAAPRHGASPDLKHPCRQRGAFCSCPPLLPIHQKHCSDCSWEGHLWMGRKERREEGRKQDLFLWAEIMFFNLFFSHKAVFVSQ